MNQEQAVRINHNDLRCLHIN